MITHDLPLKAFSLQPIYLSSYDSLIIGAFPDFGKYCSTTVLENFYSPVVMCDIRIRSAGRLKNQ